MPRVESKFRSPAANHASSAFLRRARASQRSRVLDEAAPAAHVVGDARAARALISVRTP